MEESEAPAKDLKLLQREHQESVQESEEANTKVMHCTNLDVLQPFVSFNLLNLFLSPLCSPLSLSFIHSKNAIVNPQG